MKRALIIIATLVSGLMASAASALRAAGLWPGTSPLGFSNVDVDGWRSDWNIGAKTADPYLCARIARHGLLALQRSEAVYLTRPTDQNGAPLTSRCTYRLNGDRQPAAWWSVTLYDADSKLPMNDDGALSVDATEVRGASHWSAIVAPTRPQGERHWLSSRNGGAFDLTLRLYRPTNEVLAAPERAIAGPTIERLSCAGDQS